MADIDQKAYEEALNAAEMSVDTIHIEGVTADNWEEKIAENNLTPVTDINGNVTGYYVDTLMSVIEPGQFSTSQKVQVYVVPTVDPTSTPENTKVNFNVQPGNGSNIKSGGQTVYMDKNDTFYNVMKAAGYDIDPDIPPEMINQMWEEYNQIDDVGGNLVKNAAAGLIDSYTGVPIGSSALATLDLTNYDLAIMNMKIGEFAGERMAWLGMEDTAMARFMLAAAKAGLTDISDIMIDDPATKALFRTQVNVGDYVQLTAVGDRDGSEFDDNWLEAFIKPMNIVEAINYLAPTPTPTVSQWENDYIYVPDDTLIPDLIDAEVYSAVHKHVNIWITQFQTSASNARVAMWGSYIDPSMDWEVTVNDRDHGYARLIPRGTFYSPHYKARWYQVSQFAGSYDAVYGPGSSTPTILIYDQESFINYLGDMTVAQAQAFFDDKFVVFSNGSIEKSNPYVEPTRDDPIVVTPNSSINDIVVQIQNDTVWPTNRITIPTYDPKTNTTTNHYYYPVTPGVDDPREINWPDFKIPEIVSPINDIVKYPTIPSAISTPIQNDPMTPTAGSNRFWTIYNPSDGQMSALGAELWQQNAIQILKQTFVNPTDGIISWSQIFLNPTQAYQDYIYLGDYKTSVDHVPVITNTKIFKNFGIIKIPRYFNDYRDFTETQVSAYLPFIGFVDLDPRDIIGCDVHLEYWQDIITGTCVATISPKVGNDAECAYQFTGNAAVQLPITAADRSRLLSGILGGATQGAAAGGSIGGPVGAIVGGALGGAIGAASGAFGVQKSNGFSANAGALTKYKTPYILIHRSIPADPLLYDAYYGNPSVTTATLKNLHGFTRVRECYVDVPRATDAEKAMIEAQLKQGVILP